VRNISGAPSTSQSSSSSFANDHRCDVDVLCLWPSQYITQPKGCPRIDSGGGGRRGLALGIQCIWSVSICLSYFQVVTLHKNRANRCRSFITNSLKLLEMKQQFWQPFEPHACALFPQK